eukprot:scaffold99945_cov37-Tisochrysis_lutea.AAC.1
MPTAGRLVARTCLLAVVYLAARLDAAVGNAHDPACCAYPEHDPHDHDYPYSHLRYSGVLPDVIGSFIPMTELKLTYQTGDIVHPVQYGKPIAPRWLVYPPAVSFDLNPESNSTGLHTLIMVDPDVPFRDVATNAERVHWLIYDMMGNDTRSARTLIEYEGVWPRSCNESDDLCLKEHRVTFVLFEQPHGRLTLHEEDVHIAAGIDVGRLKFKTRDFASRHRLDLHIAVNFFETWYDDRPMHSNDPPFGQMPWWHVTDTDGSLQEDTADGVHEVKDEV